jgi:hypothetical protein
MHTSFIHTPIIPAAAFLALLPFVLAIFHRPRLARFISSVPCTSLPQNPSTVSVAF